jgi:hypothetical protein
MSKRELKSSKLPVFLITMLMGSSGYILSIENNFRQDTVSICSKRATIMQARHREGLLEDTPSY